MTENDLRQLQQYGATFAGDADEYPSQEYLDMLPSRNAKPDELAAARARIEALENLAEYWKERHSLSETDYYDQVKKLAAENTRIEALEADRDNQKHITDGLEHCLDGIEEVLARWFCDDTYQSAKDVVAAYDAGQKRIAELEAENVRLRNALRPFAMAAEDSDVRISESKRGLRISNENYAHLIFVSSEEALSVKHLRAAAAALEGKSS